MPSLKAMVVLLVMVTLVAAAVAKAEDRTPDYVPVTSADIKWSPLPSMPKGAQVAVLHGSLGKPGLFTLRVKLPPHFKVPVHSNPDERVRTIISGTYYSALGDKVDESKLMAFPAGTFSAGPPNVWQFAETRDEEVIFEITGIGPTGINYLNPADDPRKSR